MAKKNEIKEVAISDSGDSASVSELATNYVLNDSLFNKDSHEQRQKTAYKLVDSFDFIKDIENFEADTVFQKGGSIVNQDFFNKVEKWKKESRYINDTKCIIGFQQMNWASFPSAKVMDADYFLLLKGKNPFYEKGINFDFKHKELVLLSANQDSYVVKKK